LAIEFDISRPVLLDSDQHLAEVVAELPERLQAEVAGHGMFHLGEFVTLQVLDIGWDCGRTGIVLGSGA
jgi:hypothetical protein